MTSISDLGANYPVKRVTPDNEREQINKLFARVVELIPADGASGPAGGGGGVNRQVWGEITGVLSDQTDLQTALDAASGQNHTPVSGNISPTLASISNGEVFTNTSAATTYTVTLPNTGLGTHVGKKFYFNTQSTYGGPLTVTCGTAGLMRDSSETSAPYTVTSGGLQVTVCEGAVGTYYYSVTGDYT